MVQEHTDQSDYVGTDWERVLMKVPPGQFHPPHKPQPGQTYFRSLNHRREVEQLQSNPLIPPGNLGEKRTLATTHIQQRLSTIQRKSVQNVLSERPHRFGHQRGIVRNNASPKLLRVTDASVREVFSYCSITALR